MPSSGTSASTRARIGLVGFSFGSPQALAASAHPDVRDRLAGVVGFGGYCDLERTILFQLTGRHEWEGRVHHLRPDPYGRWIVAANYLTAVPGMEDADEVARGLRRLAALAGDRGVMSWDEQFDPVKKEIRARLGPGRHREVFDLFAPVSEQDGSGVAGEEWGDGACTGRRRRVAWIQPSSRGRCCVRRPVRCTSCTACRTT